MDRLCGTAACYAQVKPAQPGRSDGPRRWCHALGAIIVRRACPGWSGGASAGARLWMECGKALDSSTTAKRWLCQAIGLKMGLTEEVGRRWVAGSCQRGDVSMEGGSGGVAAALGAVLRLEAEARGVRVQLQSRKKSTV
jgi:hypothetical protein